MKRFSLLGLGFVGLVGSVLAGCPIFPDDGHGDPGGYQCQGPGCPCSAPTDCVGGESCGEDLTCHDGDCTFNGCPTGYSCSITVNDAVCVSNNPATGGSGTGGTSGNGGSSASNGSTSSSGTGGAPPNAGSASSSSAASTATSSTASSASSSSSSSSSSGGTQVYCGHPADCAESDICSSNGTCQPGPCSATNTCILGYFCANDGTCQSDTAGSCDKDADCTSGSACVATSMGGGVCTAAANQCFDQSQCGTNESCLAGKCIPSCTSNADCRDGFDCNTVTGVCSVVVTPCTITNDCGSATLVCVGGACVPRSTNGICGSGDVWDENGCVPNQGATFTCSTDGAQGNCATGSICLHHDCWISCDTPNQNACVSQPTLNTCKPVSDNGTTYNVCGTSSNLGNQCGAGTPNNATCASGVCVDGYCK